MWCIVQLPHKCAARGIYLFNDVCTLVVPWISCNTMECLLHDKAYYH